MTAVAIGLLLDSFGQDMRVLFYGYAAVQGTYILTISTFPVATDGSADSSSDKPSSHPTLSAGEYWVALLSTRGVPLFLVLLLIMGTCKSTVDVFLFLHLQDDVSSIHEQSTPQPIQNPTAGRESLLVCCSSELPHCCSA